jgi:tetratricopeptide (TPR) repeat protein
MGVLMESYEKEDEALEYYEKAIEVGERENDICSEAYFNAANLKCRKNLFDTAMMILASGYNLTGDEKLLYEQVTVARRSGDFDDAEELLKEYYRKKTDAESAVKYMVDLAHITRERGDYEKALSLYLPLVKSSADAGLEAGKIFMYMGQYRDAVECIRTAIEIYEKENKGTENLFILSEYYLWAAKAAREGGFREMAEQFADEGLTVIPADYEKMDSCQPMLHQMMGGHHVILGEYDIAEEYLAKALTERKCDYCVHGYCIDACFEMIYLCLLTGRREEALEYLKKGVAVDPVDTDFRAMKEHLL